MTARCGSFDPAHRAKSCRACQHIYDERSRSKKPRLRDRMLAVAARCEFCGIVAGNSRAVKVYRYTLRRSVRIGDRRTSRALGSIGICDQCLRERKLVNNQLRRLVAA